MKDTKSKEFIQVSNEYSILVNPVIKDLEQKVLPNTSIILFEEDFKETNIFASFLSNSNIHNMLVVSKKHLNFSNPKLVSLAKIDKGIIKLLSNNILILINLNNNYEYMKFIVTSMSTLFKITKNHNKKVSFLYSNTNIICSIFNTSIYLEDIINCFRAILIEDKQKRYEFIYDTACNYLDKQFVTNNLCDFKNNQCIANRKRCTNHENMGCCYSFKYANFFDFRLVKDVRICKYMGNKTCLTKNITCKLYTCQYLKDKNVRFDSHKILILECFFNKKQHWIIQSNFFKSREEILNKLAEKNKDVYWWYIIRRKYFIGD